MFSLATTPLHAERPKKALAALMPQQRLVEEYRSAINPEFTLQQKVPTEPTRKDVTNLL